MLGAYNIEYCKQFNEVKLRKMYNGEKKEVLDALVKECKGGKTKADAKEEEVKVEEEAKVETDTSTETEPTNEEAKADKKGGSFFKRS